MTWTREGHTTSEVDSDAAAEVVAHKAQLVYYSLFGVLYMKLPEVSLDDKNALICHMLVTIIGCMIRKEFSSQGHKENAPMCKGKASSSALTSAGLTCASNFHF